MFDPSDTARVFGTPPGVDFPKALVSELHRRMAAQPPEAMARVTLIVNTQRMARRIRDLFDQGPPTLLPRVRLVTDLGEDWLPGVVPRPVPALRRRLEMTQLVSSLLDARPDLAPRTSLFNLAGSLANLMDEMQGEGVPPDRIKALDITDQSGHWARVIDFLGIVSHYFEESDDEPDKEARQRLVIEKLSEIWAAVTPTDPVIVAGSTGSRGATQLLMQAVARLPQGALILPGFDFDMPSTVWDAMDDARRYEDHPQYRYRKLLDALSLSVRDVRSFCDTPPANTERNKLVSLALRPAPVTDQWLTDGPDLGNLANATDGMTFVEAPSSRAEALAIALRLRQAAEDGQTAALITPDRTLTRQVTAALDRWHIIPDDSAGQPLHLSPPGRFLRHVAELFGKPLDAVALLTLLKHPLTHTGGMRGDHLRLTRELELYLRRYGAPFLEPEHFLDWAEGQSDPLAPKWAQWIGATFCGHSDHDARPLSTFVSAHLDLAQRIADGCQPEKESELWQEAAGRVAQAATDELSDEAAHGGNVTPREYQSLFHGIVASREVRNPNTPHPNILIWGTLEARVQGADLLILAGLNEGVWPGTPEPDPWLNRAMRHRAGLLLPERRIGLSAHDFQQAIAAPEVWLTRAIRSDDSETVASRWINRLTNLLGGLPPEQGGADALMAMRGRGAMWLERARTLEAPGETAPAPRPAPCPPKIARPDHLSVTEIQRLIRDPYAIYAKHVLRLRPLNPLMQTPDYLLRGIVVHKVLEDFIRESVADATLLTKGALIEKTEAVLTENVPWAEARLSWLARVERIADWFIETEQIRRKLATPKAFEQNARLTLQNPDFTLTAQADRIDLTPDGRVVLYDYKTGSPPTEKQQLQYDRQLLLESVMAELDGFGELGPHDIAGAVYIGLASGGKEEPAPLNKEPTDKVLAEFRELIGHYLSDDAGFTARRAMMTTDSVSDYDQLARFGEWDITDTPVRMKVGK